MKVAVYIVIAAVISMMASADFAGAGDDQNLLPDPEFRQADFTPPQVEQDTSWYQYKINAPGEAELDNGAVILTGGKMFLHSSRFNVEAGETYTVNLKADGEATVSVEILWWPLQENDIDRVIDTAKLENADQTLSGAAEAPENAERAQLRIIVKDGTATIHSPEMARE